MKTSDILREYAKDFGACGPQYAAIVENLKKAAKELDEVKDHWFSYLPPQATEYAEEYSEWCDE